MFGVAAITTPLAPPADRQSLPDLLAGPLVLVGAAMTALTIYLGTKGHIWGFDFRGGAWAAGRDVLAGRSPYPAPDPAKLLAQGNAYIPPPLLAFLCGPLALLPFVPAVVVFGVACTAALVLALRIVGVRDWRVYGLALTSYPLVVSLGTDRDLALFAAALSFGLLASPIMWTHYLVVLYVPLAIAHRRPEVWLLTIPFWLSPLEPPPHVWKVFWVLALTVVVSVLSARRASSGDGELFDEPVLVRVPRRLGPVLDAELAVDVRQVELHRLLGDPELLADLLVREAPGELRQQRRLALAQAEVLARAPRRLELAVDRERIAVGRGAQRNWEVARVAALRHE